MGLAGACSESDLADWAPGLQHIASVGFTVPIGVCHQTRHVHSGDASLASVSALAPRLQVGVVQSGKVGAAGAPDVAEAPAPQQKVCLTCRRSFDLRHFKKVSSQPDGRWVNCRGCSHVKRRLDKMEREMAAAGAPGPSLDRCLLHSPATGAATIN